MGAAIAGGCGSSEKQVRSPFRCVNVTVLCNSDGLALRLDVSVVLAPALQQTDSSISCVNRQDRYCCTSTLTTVLVMTRKEHDFSTATRHQMCMPVATMSTPEYMCWCARVIRVLQCVARNARDPPLHIMRSWSYHFHVREQDEHGSLELLLYYCTSMILTIIG